MGGILFVILKIINCKIISTYRTMGGETDEMKIVRCLEVNPLYYYINMFNLINCNFL